MEFTALDLAQAMAELYDNEMLAAVDGFLVCLPDEADSDSVGYVELGDYGISVRAKTLAESVARINRLLNFLNAKLKR